MKGQGGFLESDAVCTDSGSLECFEFRWAW